MQARFKKMIATLSAAALIIPMLVVTAPTAAQAASDIYGGGSSVVVNGTGSQVLLEPLIIKAIDDDDIDGTIGVVIDLDVITPLSTNAVKFDSSTILDISCVGTCSGFAVNTINQASDYIEFYFDGTLIAGDSLVIGNIAVEGVSGESVDYEGPARLKVTTGAAYDVAYGDVFNVDARRPVVNSITSDATAGVMMKIGDTINFNLTTVEIDPGLDIEANYNGHDLSWTTVDNGVSYQAQYIVAAGDIDQLTPLQLMNVVATDINGNSSVAFDGTDITNTIDANGPTIAVTSPATGSAYNTQPTLEYSLTDSTSGLADSNADVTLSNNNGIYSLGHLPTGTTLSDVAEGNNDLVVEAVDNVGNISQQIIHFTYDITTPTITVTESPDKQNILLTNNLVFAGTTEANANVQLEIYSTPFIVTSTADSAGAWRFEIPSDQIGVGNYTAKLTVTDAAGNSINSVIATFAIYQATTTTKIYQSSYTLSDEKETKETVSTSEVTPTVDTLEDVIDATDETGSIKAASTENDDADSNTWETIVTVIAILIIAIGVGTAGYYAYEWWASKEEPVPLEPKKLKKKKKTLSTKTKATTGQKTKKKSSSQKGRW